MSVLGDSLTPLEIRSEWTVKDEEGEEGRVHKTCTAEEESAQLRVFAFLTVRGMEEPDGGVDTDTETAKGSNVEAILEGEVGERTGMAGRPEDLSGSS